MIKMCNKYVVNKLIIDRLLRFYVVAYNFRWIIQYVCNCTVEYAKYKIVHMISNISTIRKDY